MTYRMLPVEVLEKIVDLCTDGHLPEYGVLTTLTLTGRALLLRARRNLYRHVVLTTLRQLHAFLRTMEGASFLAVFIQELTLRTGQHYVPAGTLLQLMGYARIATLDIPVHLYPLRFSYARTRIQHLRVKATHFAPLRRLVRACPELRSLSLRGFSYDKGYQERAFIRSQTLWLPDTVRCISLQAFKGPIDAVLSDLGLVIPYQKHDRFRRYLFATPDYLRCRLLCRGQATAWRAVDVLIPITDVMTHFFDPFFDPIYTVLNQLASTCEYLQSSLPDRGGLLQQPEANIYHPQTYHLHTPSMSALDSRQTASDASALSVISPSNIPSEETRPETETDLTRRQRRPRRVHTSKWSPKCEANPVTFPPRVRTAPPNFKDGALALDPARELPIVDCRNDDQSVEDCPLVYTEIPVRRTEGVVNIRSPSDTGQANNTGDQPTPAPLALHITADRQFGCLQNCSGVAQRQEIDAHIHDTTPSPSPAPRCHPLVPCPTATHHVALGGTPHPTPLHDPSPARACERAAHNWTTEPCRIDLKKLAVRKEKIWIACDSFSSSPWYRSLWQLDNPAPKFSVHSLTSAWSWSASSIIRVRIPDGISGLDFFSHLNITIQYF
ncbi:hypothetical protein C2E23DRAFT_80026 [Lenzites betulinus]|nr:hypothetical protein C2E23DRAFT_80026 [Lenzites betulinus]